ncbi:MAG: GNAT family N-acetyltransferase [Candidatus Heimdallarchaeota archaeon]|nr:GNAT family N-acetyltransferase [Candidatus Heimdallarchaeota archaeon]
MKIDFLKIDELDLKEYAELAFHSKLPIYRNLSFEDIEKGLQENISKYKTEVVIVAKKNDVLLGCLALYIFNELKIAQVWNWHPLVLPQKNQNSIVNELIKQSIKYSKKKEQKQLSIDFVNINSLANNSFKKYEKWYAKNGINFFSEEFFYQFELSELSNEEIVLPTKFKIKPLLSFDWETIYQCWQKIFSASTDRFFHSLTLNSKEDYFDESWKNATELIPEGSIALVKEEKLIGFSRMLSIYNPGDGCLAPIGILPEYRGKGLAKKLLLISMKNLLTIGYKTISLFVDSENKDAISLYDSLGFSKKYSIISLLGDLI